MEIGDGQDSAIQGRLGFINVAASPVDARCDSAPHEKQHSRVPFSFRASGCRGTKDTVEVVLSALAEIVGEAIHVLRLLSPALRFKPVGNLEKSPTGDDTGRRTGRWSQCERPAQ
ncbi:MULTISPECIES: hypothetical protein [Roseomonadaceae]|uniref:Uncharacterized protein n=1 Tax=Falsiroseomonas oleicola TaxID=2801474 RepID=A0ABS6HAL8_9PROT|nr:hypothetical protein [Roseomonas oleicola]MBU8545777.1 hypothetical protein [Roseomonas oleicola]